VILRLTVQDVSSRQDVDVEVAASPDTAVGALLDSLPVYTRGRQCFVGATALDESARLADSPLLAGAALSVGGPGPDYHPVRSYAAGALHVISGPDAGSRIPLPPGRYRIGRALELPIRLNDQQVSRNHAVIDVLPDGRVTIEDIGSANGTLVNGTKVTGPTPVDNRSMLRLGGDTLLWAPATADGLRTTRSPDGRLEFDRVFAPTPALRERDVELPPRDARRQNATQLVLTSIGGLVMGPLMFASSGLHNPLMLLCSLLGVVFPSASYGVERFQHRGEKRTLAAARESAQQQVNQLAAEEAGVRHLLAPGPAEISAIASGVRKDLWCRDANSELGLTLRVGVTDQAPGIRLRGEPWPEFELPSLRGVPVTVNLRETGVLGVVGTGEAARALLRWLVVQLATLRSPDDLGLVVLTSGQGEHLAWTRWLPHLDTGSGSPPCLIGNTDASRAARIAELRDLIASRRPADGGAGGVRPGTDREVVVVIDGALALRNMPGMHDVLRNGPEVGVYALCADSQGITECRGQCEVTANSFWLTPSPAAPMITGIREGMDVAAAEQAARALAPMRDRAVTAVENAIPYPVRLLDLLRIGVPTAGDILTLWRGKQEGPATRVLLGADAAGPVHVDLALQGPHTMLGGATGAGKSILLQTLVTALLLANRPDELNLVLVDFKGGSAFLPFEHCPHVSALIRSTGKTAADRFDLADAARMLASVRTEVARRESILAPYGGEIDSYWRARRSQPDLPPLPRLVMIFDEFARVLDISPDFLRELVNVAGKGRSIGMHLVLATQSLQGKLSPELKNNITLRISLRQNEPADSSEVLGTPEAATIPGSLKGRGMIFWTAGESRTPRAFQSGYLGDPPPLGSGSGRLSVRTVAWPEIGVAAVNPDTHVIDGATDQELTIKAIEEAARKTAATAPFRPLLPALPAVVPLDELAGLQTDTPRASAVPFGLADLPAEQAQPAYFLDLAGTDRLMVAGGPQSGRTTFARALITSLAARFRPDQAHLYVIEHQPAGLADYAGLPHCGAVFAAAEPDRIRRFVGWLTTETERRTMSRFTAGGEDDPVIVVVVDGWEQFESRANPALAEVSLGPALRAVMASGAPLGLHIVPVGGQDLLTGKVPALCNQRLLLHFPNEDIRRAQLRGGMTLPPPVAGRAVDAATGHHVQICEPDAAAADVVADTAARHEPADLDAARLPRPFPSLPAKVTVGELALPEPLPSRLWVPLGVGGPDVVTVGADFFGGGDPHLMLIAGSPGTGRSTAIATLGRLLSWNGVDVLAIAPPQSPLAGMLADEENVTVLTAMSIGDAALREAVAPFGERRYAVLLDDAEKITVQATKQGFNDAPTLLDEIVRPDALGRCALIMAGDATPILSGSRRSLQKVTSEIMMSGTRLLLNPAKRADARDFKLSLEPDQYFTGLPGRGYLASTGAPALIQLAQAV
jgi:S-DNA-T family DNA segregation ATPase FtsK/SpoIIIE